MKRLWCVALTILLSLPCWAQANNQDPESSVYTEAKTAIVVTKNKSTFTIKLKSNPTTGYQWFLREYNSSLMQPIKHRVESSVNKKMMGAPGYEIWTFKMKPAAFVVPQQTTIRLIYVRPWETMEGATQIVFHVSSSLN